MRQAKWLHAWRSHSVAPQRVQLPRFFFWSGWEELLAAEEGGPIPSCLPKEAEGRERGVEEIVEVGAVGDTFGMTVEAEVCDGGWGGRVPERSEDDMSATTSEIRLCQF